MFKKGQKVVLLPDKETKQRFFSVSDLNPYFPDVLSLGCPVIGEVISGGSTVEVQWPAGRNTYPNGKDLALYSDWVKGNDPKANEPKLKHFDKLVLSEDKKRSIVSVIKQSQFADKIFNDWGLKEVIEYGRGMTMLFHGPPGTGKTFCAHCVAKAMGKELRIMDNAALQSSTPGEMERNIKEAFSIAKRNGDILMFDECDSLLSARANVGMIIGSEINCLLTEIERFEGVCILTTNRIGELDEALERRISLIVKFPKPDKDSRKAIWDKMLPKKLPLAKDVDKEKLAESELTGGLIKNAVLNAARLACANDKEEVGMGEFEEAILRISQGTKAFETPSVAPSCHVSMGKGMEKDKAEAFLNG